MPFDEVAAAQAARTHTHTHTLHTRHTYTHSPVLKSSLACERMRECSQIFPSFLPVIPPDLLPRAEFARSRSPGGHTHALTHTQTHTHTHTHTHGPKADFKTSGTFAGVYFSFLIIRQPKLHLTVGHKHSSTQTHSLTHTRARTCTWTQTLYASALCYILNRASAS